MRNCENCNHYRICREWYGPEGGMPNYAEIVLVNKRDDLLCLIKMFKDFRDYMIGINKEIAIGIDRCMWITEEYKKEELGNNEKVIY